MSKPTIADLKSYIKDQLEALPVLERLERFIREGTSTAGTRHEEVFTREFLCPAIGRYFYEHVRSELRMSDDDIRAGLGTEGFKNCPGFGFTPARRRKHLFNKTDVIAPRPPTAWLAASGKSLPAFQSCPDFAIAKPLPFSVVGEVKYFKAGSSEIAVRELYNAARQAIFYLGAFHDLYDSAMIVVADASPGHAFHEGLVLIEPELLHRFGSETNIHLVAIKLG
ncbi:MAG: hypothetical protein KKA73_08690 [Chloroflexi bacterium]|nr:hypothetical protein [Chloroflexota bacterium]MBU1747754.1 hypothetical protein [Chloroflexota bacterium]